MISIKEIVAIHEILIDHFGGLQGICDKDSFEAALNRPLQTFDNKELYPSILEKVAALLESLIKNHP